MSSKPEKSIDVRVRRFTCFLSAVVGPEKTAELIESCGELYAGSRGTEKAKYAKCLMDNFEKQFTEKVRVKVLENCGRHCIGTSTIERAKKIGKNAKTLEDLVFRLNEQYVGGGKLRVEGNKIYGEYKRCYCGMVNKTKEKFSSTWCNCSRGYLLELFEQTLGKPVKVDLLESVIQGAKTCKFAIQT